MSISITTAYKTSLSIPYGQLKDVISWCQTNCQEDWRFQETTNNIDPRLLHYDFYFENEKDYVAFLIWKK